MTILGGLFIVGIAYGHVKSIKASCDILCNNTAFLNLLLTSDSDIFSIVHNDDILNDVVVGCICCSFSDMSSPFVSYFGY